MYYGWWIVAGVFLVLTVSSGFGFYNLSVYINVLAAARGFSVTDVSVAVSLFFVVGGVAGMAVARLIERHDVRWVMLGGALMAGTALALVGFARSLWQLYLLFLVFGTGNAAVSIVPATTLVTRWFPGANRSIALSIASTGLSFGGIALTPLCARLLNEWGVAAAMPWFGAAFFLLVLPFVLWVVRSHPPAAPQRLDGAAGAPDWSYRDAVRSRFFLLLTAGYVICMGSQVGGIAHLYNRAEQVADYRGAALAVQALTAMSILGRFAGGWLVTRVPIRQFTLGNLVGQGLGLALIATAGGTGQVLAGAAIFGSTVGNLLMLQPLWLAEAFGGPAYARIFSLANAVTVLGVAAGPVVLGAIYDAAGYRPGYLTATLGSLAALVLIASAGAAPAQPLPVGEPCAGEAGE